jgi:VanZ family protein
MMSARDPRWRELLSPWLGYSHFWKAVTLAMMAAVWWSSSRTFDTSGAGLPSSSMNLLHFLAYAVMAVAAGLGFGAARYRNPPAWGRWLAGATLVWGFGLADELHQARVPGRFCSVFDFIVDGLGAGFGILLAAVIWQGEGAWTPRRRLLAIWLLALGVILALYGFRWFPGFDAALRGY